MRIETMLAPCITITFLCCIVMAEPKQPSNTVFQRKRRRSQSTSTSTPLSYRDLCGMQTPGTLIVDGGKYDRSFEDSTSQAIWQNIPNSDPMNAKLVLIPGAESEMESEERDKYTDLWTDTMGFRSENFHILHPESDESDKTNVGDAVEADSPEFVEPLLEADAVFVRGGRQWRLVDAFKYTLTNEALWDLLDRGGVVAGTSAGATSQGFFMPRGDPRGSGQLVADREWHQYGFGYLPNVAFDVHVDARDRWEDLYDVIREDTSLLGIGIAEKTAIVVQGHYFQVVGYEGERDDPDALEEDDDLRSSVAVYDCADRDSCNEDDSPFLELGPGQWYDLCSRRVVSGPDTPSPRVSRMYHLPYDFTTDYRLAAPSFLCSGRYCRWMSSTIDLMREDETYLDVKPMMLQLTSLLESDGDMEDDEDYLQISYRLSTDASFQSSTRWTTAHSLIRGAFEGIYPIRDTLVISDPTQFRYLQFKIEAETSSEGGETYRVQYLQVEEIPYVAPTPFPTEAPTRPPTRPPTQSPTNNPTPPPTRSPTMFPTEHPTRSPALPPIVTEEPTTSVPTTNVQNNDIDSEFLTTIRVDPFRVNIMLEGADMDAVALQKSTEDMGLILGDYFRSQLPLDDGIWVEFDWMASRVIDRITVDGQEVKTSSILIPNTNSRRRRLQKSTSEVYYSFIMQGMAYVYAPKSAIDLQLERRIHKIIVDSRDGGELTKFVQSHGNSLQVVSRASLDILSNDAIDRNRTNEGGSSSLGLILGLVFGTLALLLSLLVLGWFLRHRYRQRLPLEEEQEESDTKKPPSTSSTLTMKTMTSTPGQSSHLDDNDDGVKETKEKEIFSEKCDIL